MKNYLIVRCITALASLTLLILPAASAKNAIERPFRIVADGVAVISLLDGSFEAIEWGTASHTGLFVNNYSGYLDLAVNRFSSGGGTITAANGDELDFEIIPYTSSSIFTGGTGRFAEASGPLSWTTTDVVTTVDLATMTMTFEYHYTGSGTVSY